MPVSLITLLLQYSNNMKAKPLPPQSLLNAILEYNPTTGLLTWQQRSADTFKVREGRSPKHIMNIFNARFANKPAFTSMSKNGYLRGSINSDMYYAHRVIYMMVTGSDPLDIDHDNGVRHDNRWLNIFSKSRGDNLKNRELSRNNTSGYHGVSFSIRHQLWVVSIYHNRVRVHLGWFKDKNDAIATRKAAELHYGYHVNHGRAKS